MQYESQKGKKKDRQDNDIYKEGRITYTTLIKPNLHLNPGVVPICQEVLAHDHHTKHRR
jgi:hypothetical protein